MITRQNTCYTCHSRREGPGGGTACGRIGESVAPWRAETLFYGLDEYDGDMDGLPVLDPERQSQSRACPGYHPSPAALRNQRRVMQNRLAEFGFRVPLNSIASDGRSVLTREHEGSLMAEWGPRALLGYYAPGVELEETP